MSHVKLIVTTECPALGDISPKAADTRLRSKARPPSPSALQLHMQVRGYVLIGYDILPLILVASK